MAFKPKFAKQDFTVQMLPHNRKEVFFDVLKLNWRSFISYGLLMLLFSLPCFILALSEDTVVMKLMESYNAALEQEKVNILTQICLIKNTRAALDIVSYMVLSIGVAGVIRVVRQYAWGESVFFRTDFSKGIKQNSLQMLFIGFLFGIVNLLTVSAYNMLALTTDGYLAIIAILSVNILLLVAIPVFAYSIVSISVYEKKLSGHLLTALAVTAKSPFKTLLAIVCCLIPFSIQLIPISYCHIFGRIISSILIPFIMLGWMLFAFNRFDELINKQKHPELVGKGTFPLENGEMSDNENVIDGQEADK